MKTRDLFADYLEYKSRYMDMLDRYEEINSTSLRSPVLSERVQTTRNLHKMETDIIRREEHLLRMARRFAHMRAARRYLESRVCRLNSPHKEVLMLHYISGRSFREISTLYDIPVRRIYYLHGAALKKFEKQFGDEYQGCENLGQVIKKNSNSK